MNRNDEDYFVKRSVPYAEESEKKKSAVKANSEAEKNKAPTTRRATRLAPDNEKKNSGGHRDEPPKVNGVKKTQHKGSNLPERTADRTTALAEKQEKRGFIDHLVFPGMGKPGSVDMVFLVVFIMLLAIGTVMSFSASYAYAAKKYGDSYYFVIKHLQFLLIGAFAILMVMIVHLEYYKGGTYGLTALAVILLILVLFIGSERGGAKRWIEIPGLGSFQPSELAKTALVMLMALYLSKYGDKAQTPGFKKSFLYGMIYPGLIILFMGGLVVLEKHFSGLIILGSIGVFIMILGGTKLKFLLPIAGVAIALIGALILFTDYSSTRIEVWFDPWSNPQGSGWQTIQGLYAIASGGIGGVGLGNSRQKYGYVAEPQNDFIFTIVCEELGFVGALAVMALFFILIWRGFVIARHSPNRFTYLLVAGLMIKVALQVGFNIGVVTNSIPNTGISLPFFSSGGTSLIVQMAEMGMVLSISRYSHNKK